MRQEVTGICYTDKTKAPLSTPLIPVELRRGGEMACKRKSSKKRAKVSG